MLQPHKDKCLVSSFWLHDGGDSYAKLTLMAGPQHTRQRVTLRARSPFFPCSQCAACEMLHLGGVASDQNYCLFQVLVALMQIVPDLFAVAAKNGQLPTDVAANRAIKKLIALLQGPAPLCTAFFGLFSLARPMSSPCAEYWNDSFFHRRNTRN
jgi:hypothetical protein